MHFPCGISKGLIWPPFVRVSVHCVKRVMHFCDGGLVTLVHTRFVSAETTHPGDGPEAGPTKGVVVGSARGRLLTYGSEVRSLLPRPPRAL